MEAKQPGGYGPALILKDRQYGQARLLNRPVKTGNSLLTRDSGRLLDYFFDIKITF